MWNDDFHHSAIVALTGRREAYYTDYRGLPQEFISAAKYGYLFQGQWYSWQKKRRGTPGLDLPGSAFITFLQNHDQVANSAFGRRVHELSSPARYRALTALLLLGPGTPLLFQGQEFASSAPFLYFADHPGELGRECAHRTARIPEPIPQPDRSGHPGTAARLRETASRSSAAGWILRSASRTPTTYRLHRDLLHLRRTDPTIASAGVTRVDGAVLVAGRIRPPL